MEKILQDYTGGKIHFTPIMNIMGNNYSKDWYAELGKYIVDTIDIEKVSELSFLTDEVKQKKKIVTKMKDFFSDSLYFSISSFFLTSALNDKSLKKMFGEPILHNEFGEGFDGEYDEETDEMGEPDIKESYASYFVTVGGTNFHIGYDHRGTTIEIQENQNSNWKMKISDKSAESCFESLKKLVDLYKEKAL